MDAFYQSVVAHDFGASDKPNLSTGSNINLTRTETRSDVFDYIERFDNAEKQCKLEQDELKNLSLTKPSVETG